MSQRPFKVLGIQQIAIGGPDKARLRRLWVDLFGLEVTGTFVSERENVDENICALGSGPFKVEVDLMQPLDPDKKPAVHTTPLNHVGLWVDERLAQAWAQRQPSLPLRSPEEALILASIIEKETGDGSDRPLIAGVFINRLRIGMRLQSDPTVIYGLGERFDGNLRRRDLLTDTPYNTYTRAGLPPTPIAMPGPQTPGRNG